MVTGSRAARAAGLGMIVAMAATSAACSDILVSGPAAELGNVAVTIGAAVVQSDTAVVVNGHTLVRHPSIDQALWLDRFERFEHGGFPELGYDQAERHSLGWRVMLTHGHPPDQRGDITVFRFVDHGDVALGGIAMEKLVDPPGVGPADPVLFENFVRYLAPSYSRVAWQAGGSTTFVDTPFHPDLVAGDPVVLETSGSEEAEPAATSLVARPFAALVGLENGTGLDLHGAMPIIDVEQPLVFAFNRALDPSRAFIILIPFENRPDAAPAFVQPTSPTRRVILPPHSLRQLVTDPAAGTVAFRAFVVELIVEHDAFTGHITGDGPAAGHFSLPFVQRAETSVNLYLRR